METETKAKSRRFGMGHTVTITSQNQNYASSSKTAGPNLFIFVMQNPHKFRSNLCKIDKGRQCNSRENECRRFIEIDVLETGAPTP